MCLVRSCRSETQGRARHASARSAQTDPPSPLPGIPCCCCSPALPCEQWTAGQSGAGYAGYGRRVLALPCARSGCCFDGQALLPVRLFFVCAEAFNESASVHLEERAGSLVLQQHRRGPSYCNHVPSACQVESTTHA